MQGIQVPDNLKHMIAKDKVSTEDHMPQIRHYIENNSGQPLTNVHFQGLLNRTSAMVHVRKLMKAGYITRTRIQSGRGKHYSYTWHAIPLETHRADLKNGKVVTHRLNLPELLLPEGVPERLTELFTEWIDTLPQPLNGDSIAGAINFRRWLALKNKEVLEERDKIINDHNNSNNSNVVSVQSTTKESEEK